MELTSSIEQVQGYIRNATKFQGIKTESMTQLTNMQRNAEKIPITILEDSLQLTKEAIDKCRKDMIS